MESDLVLVVCALFWLLLVLCSPCCRWPRYWLCKEQVLLLHNFSYTDLFGWGLPADNNAQTPPAPVGPAGNSTPAQQLPPALVQRLGLGYMYTSGLKVHFINSTWLCGQPSAACASQPTNGTHSPCLLDAYAAFMNDSDAAAAAAEAAAAAAMQDPGNYGVSGVLPAVLASVGEFVCLHACRMLMVDEE